MRILIAEDDNVSRRLLEARLAKWGYEVVASKDGEEAWDILQREDTPRLVILDWMMPGMDGIEVCREVRKRLADPYTYIILLTAKAQSDDLIEAMEAGADDYIIKPFEPNELKVRLRAGRRILELQDALISAREALRVQATQDALTGLWNRSAILDILTRELARSEREGKPIGLIIADLDHFKRINDTYGHIVGDAVLKEAAARMRASVRPYDAIGRYGGEEFLIILPGCNAQGLQNTAERIRLSICSDAMVIPDGMISLSMSLGAVSTDVLEKKDAEALICAVDEALYLAKSNGRNRFELAGPGILQKNALQPQEPASIRLG